jgi:hypothetical protein
MGKLKITDFFLYRNRYLASYGIIGLILIALLFVSGTLVPGGLSELEVTAATKSSNLSFSAILGNQADAVVNLPYRLLQSASLHVFGMSTVSIKFPSLVLAAASILLLYGALELWFRRNVAIITSLITMTSSQFLLQSQSGTAGIVYMFWGALLLFTASMVASSKKFRPLWIFLTAATAGLSLYTPYMLYVIIPLIIAACIHPHARFIVFRQPLWVLLLSVIVFSATLLPLGNAAIHDPFVVLKAVAGEALSSGRIDPLANISQLTQYLDFYNNKGGRILQPAFGLGLLLLAVVGAAHLISTKYTAKSYIMVVWILLTIPILIINPDAAGVAILPISLLCAFAIDFLIARWYTMFPRNPYARVAGLLPLGILVLVLSLSSMDRFIYGYRYDPEAVKAYSTDLRLLQSEIDWRKDQTVRLVVTEQNKRFYQAFITRNKLSDHVTVSTEQTKDTTSAVVIISGAMYAASTDKVVPSKIIVSQTTNDANRFYVYENSKS